MLSYPINITVDTNVFEAAKYDLSESSVLSLLRDYVKAEKIKLYISNIVLREIDAHLGKIGSGLYTKIRKNRKELLEKACDQIIKTSNLELYVTIPDKHIIIKNIRDSFNEYIKSIDPVIFDNSTIIIDDVLDDYFSIEPPFAESGEKRKEFPDAFIAKQIRANFKSEDTLVIISNDEGFKAACQKDRNYIFVDSLGELFNLINEQDSKYQKIIERLGQSLSDITNSITNEINDEQNIIVNGLSYDRKGQVSGYDYSETFLRSIENVSCKLHVVEDIKDNDVIVTLSCSADIEMNCIFEDFDNSPWDSEEKEYLFVDAIHVIEKHKPNFPVRVFFNLNNSDMKIVIPKLILGGDSRVKRIIE